MNQNQSKKGFLGWALSGGIYFMDGVPGSGFGGFGMAAIGAGAFKVWKSMATAPTPEMRAKLLPLFLFFGIVGIVFMGIGYYRYLTTEETVSETGEGKRNEPERLENETTEEGGKYMTNENQNNDNAETQGPLSKTFGFIGFGIGMILMIAFIPVSKDHTINGIVGGVVGMVGAGLGAWLGGLLDKK